MYTYCTTLSLPAVFPISCHTHRGRRPPHRWRDGGKPSDRRTPGAGAGQGADVLPEHYRRLSWLGRFGTLAGTPCARNLISATHLRHCAASRRSLGEVLSLSYGGRHCDRTLGEDAAHRGSHVDGQDHTGHREIGRDSARERVVKYE